MPGVAEPEEPKAPVLLMGERAYGSRGFTELHCKAVKLKFPDGVFVPRWIHTEQYSAGPLGVFLKLKNGKELYLGKDAGEATKFIETLNPQELM